MALFLTGSLPLGAMVSAVLSCHPLCTLLSKELWVSAAPGHAACRILKGQMTQTNNGLGEALTGLVGAVPTKGRISAGGLVGFLLALRMAYNRQGQYCVCTFVSPLSRCTSAGTSVSLGKYLVSSSVTRTYRE